MYYPTFFKLNYLIIKYTKKILKKIQLDSQRFLAYEHGINVTIIIITQTKSYQHMTILNGCSAISFTVYKYI